MSFKIKLNESFKENKYKTEREKTNEVINITENLKDEKIQIKKREKEKINTKTNSSEESQFEKVDF